MREGVDVAALTDTQHGGTLSGGLWDVDSCWEVVVLKKLSFAFLLIASVANGQEFPEATDKIPSQFAISLLEARESNSLGAAPTSAQARSI